MEPKDILTMSVRMTIGAKKAKAIDTEGCALVIGLSKKGLPKGSAAELDKAMGGALSKIVSGIDAGPELGKTHLVFTKSYPIKPERIILVGIGGNQKVSALEKVRIGFATAANLCEKAGLKNIVGLLPPGSSAEVAQAMAEGFALGAYQWDSYKAEKRKGATSFDVLVENAKDLKSAEKGCKTAQIIVEAVWLVRDLGNTPGNDMTPKVLGEAAQAVGKKYGFSVKVLGPKEIAQQNMQGILAVSKGSVEEPRFLELEYNGSRSKKSKPIVLVGKAITFDTGGIDLKSFELMDGMKFDMVGGAAVLGTVMAAKRLGLPHHIIGLIPCCENMPDAKAYKPGDVLRYSNGKTVEIFSTDAEGRLILADALLRAAELDPRFVVDIATLTGGMKTLFAGFASGILGNQEGLISGLVRAGEVTNERLWKLPLWPEFDELIESDTADLRNSCGKYGGSISAARFLLNFTSYPWAHIDIAGTGWADKRMGYLAKGGTAVGTRLFIQWLKDLRA